MRTCNKGHFDIVKILIDYGADVNDKDKVSYGAYLFQLRSLPNVGVVEEPIRFLGGHISWTPDTLVNHRKSGIRHLLGPSSSG